ncbi:MAG: cysteate synthase, partial [Alistipes sp.]|nr:cysteate synthase [Alistipes sp.]
GVVGGLYDALKATGGDIMVVTNPQERKACKLFEELEGVDIHPAAGVATASLIKAVQEGRIEKDATVMLNITGGGEQLFKKGREVWYLKPSHVFPLNPDVEDVVAKVEALYE